MEVGGEVGGGEMGASIRLNNFSQDTGMGGTGGGGVGGGGGVECKSDWSGRRGQGGVGTNIEELVAHCWIKGISLREPWFVQEGRPAVLKEVTSRRDGKQKLEVKNFSF